MRTNKYFLLPIVFLITSCYIYKPYTEKSLDEMAAQDGNSPYVAKSLRNDNSNNAAANQSLRDQGNQSVSPEVNEAGDGKEIQTLEQRKNEQMGNSSLSNSDGTLAVRSPKNPEKGGGKTLEEAKPKELGIKGKLEPNKYFKIKALGNQYKIQVDKWEGDTLVAHKIRKPSKQYKFHMNDIEEEAILERRFSKPFSDLLTVGAYASGAAIVLLLVL